MSLTIALEPTGTGSAGWTFPLDGDAPDAWTESQSRSVVFWGIRISSRQTVRLKTGKELKDLPGRVRFFLASAATPVSDGKETRCGELHYYEGLERGYGFPENFELDINVSLGVFETLRSAVAARAIPRVEVWVSDDDAGGIRVGWEPDGRGMDWDNEKHPRLEVQWCTFEVDAGLPKVPDDVDDQRDRGSALPSRADIVEILGTISKATQGIDKLCRRLLPVLWISAALLALLVLKRWW